MNQKTIARAAGIAAAASIALLGVAGCSSDDSDSASASSSAAASTEAGASASSGAADSGQTVELTAADGTKVTLTGAIAQKFESATDKQKTDLGVPKTGADASGTGENGVSFQQFDGGVITYKEGSPAYITWGKIRDAWNVPRDESGKPAADGKGGSQGPLGTATSDETDEGNLKVSTFENGKITWDSATDKVEVTVKGEVVPTS
ncbi:LGFP repeat-containing protein [Gordonia soli]|uniref:LGFP repeat-containing protein n=1 Tax=Gordonia soli NBRC 108243 TaxID=1223545 RepID=M0QS66_9ACTN|nr:hypothetical protein [Gordonia soli]GAC70912.1 hypothetical protein GS4_43_00390 [Gordonia soli NBRC 108243]